MIRYVALYGDGPERRLKIEEKGAYVDLTYQKMNSAKFWVDQECLSLPVEGAKTIGDVAAALVTIWDERRQAEMAERAAAAAR
jgi:hypothetical protein